MNKKDLEKIDKKLITDRYNSVVISIAKNKELYLVGGYLRDLILKKRSNDRDYLIKDDIEDFVGLLKKILGGSIVKFSKGGIIRLALRNNITLDFQSLDEDLKENLSKRDFTINALAWSNNKGLLDYFNCVYDVKRRIIRCISEDNVKEDPLRIIRAYRFAGHINGKIERKTRVMLKNYKFLLGKVAGERITSEIFNLLNLKDSYKYLKMALDDGILSCIFYIDNNRLKNNIKGILKNERYFFNTLPKDIKVKLNKVYSQNLKYKGLLNLETIFRGNDTEDLDKNVLVLSNKLKNRIRKFLIGEKLLNLIDKNKRETIFDFFNKVEDAYLDVLIVNKRLDILSEHKYFRNSIKSKLVNEETIKVLENKYKGEELGKIIEKLRKKIYTREISTKKQMFNYVNNILHNIHYRS